MISKQFKEFILLLSYNPCDIFKYYKVDEMHGLDLMNCVHHINNKNEAYIAGWCNYVPKTEEYKPGDPVFVFINLSRCTDDVHTTGLVFHEMMHCAGHVFKNNWLDCEEEMITWAEQQTYEVLNLIKRIKYEY
jgi:hypothetical protein